ncbi:hypothetical protein ABIA43_004690 [Bradyrhizobium sp. USDA 328]
MTCRSRRVRVPGDSAAASRYGLSPALLVIGWHWLLMRLTQKPVHHKPRDDDIMPLFCPTDQSEFR